MKISAKKEFKMPSIFFNRAWSNGFLIGFLVVFCFNFVVFMFIGEMIPVFALAIISMVVWVLASFFPFVDNAYEHDTHRRSENLSDLLRGTIYICILVGTLLYMDKHFQKEEIVNHRPDVTIEVASIQIYEKHASDKDSYGIKYFDADGEMVFYDSYTNLETRTAVLKRIYDDQGNIKVTMTYKVRGGQHYIIIAEKMQQLEKVVQ